MNTLERRLADTLRHEAAQLPHEEATHTLIPAEQNRTAFSRPGLVAATAVVAVMILVLPVIWLGAGRRGGESNPDTSVTNPPATAVSTPPAPATSQATAPDEILGAVLDLLPDEFDPNLATPLLVMEGNPEEVATQYLETRLPYLNVGVSRVEEQDGYTLVEWAWGRFLVETELEQGHRGWLLMRRTIRGLEILAATTEGIDLSDLTIGTGNLRGVIQSNTDDFLGADVLGLDENPVTSAPNPDGFTPGSDFPWGTAGAGTPPLALDLPVAEAVIVRVNRVGGTLLSISEVILNQDSSTGDRTDDQDGPDEELVGEGEEPLAWGTAGESRWVLVGWHLSVPDKPTQACTGVRPVVDEDWCTLPDAGGPLVHAQAFAVGEGGVIVLRTQPGVAQVRIDTDLESQVVEVHGESDGYPPTAVLGTKATPVAGVLTPLGARGEELGEPIPFSVTEYVRTPAGG